MTNSQYKPNPNCPVDGTRMLDPVDVGIDDVHSPAYFCETCQFSYRQGLSQKAIDELAESHIHTLKFRLTALIQEQSKLSRILKQAQLHRCETTVAPSLPKLTPHKIHCDILKRDVSYYSSSPHSFECPQRFIDSDASLFCDAEFPMKECPVFLRACEIEGSIQAAEEEAEPGLR